MATVHARIMDTLGNSLTSTGNALDVVVASSGLPTGASTLAEQQTQTTHLATIAGDTTSLDSKVTACNTGAVVVSSGTITANLGAVDNAVLDSIDTAVTSIDTKTSSLVFGGGVEATAQRVTLASDSTGTLTVNGTVTANLSATDNALLYIQIFDPKPY